MEQPKKPKFDPNKAYDVVPEEKPAFNPNLPYDEVKKKDSSTYSSQKKESDLVQKTGSLDGQNISGFPEIKSFNPLDKFLPKITNDGRNKKRKEQLQKELSIIKVTPENMDIVSSKTDELSALQKEEEAVKKAETNRRVNTLENSFYKATKDDNDELVAEQRLDDAVNVKGFWNNVKNISKKAYNSALQSVAVSNPGALGLIKYSADTDPLASEKKQVLSEAKQSNEKLTDSEITDRAKSLFKEKEKYNLFVDRANSFLDNLDPKDKEVLRQDRALKSEHLQEDNLKRLKVSSAIKSVAENKISQYKNLNSQIEQLNSQNKAIPEGLIQEHQSLKNQIIGLGNDLKKNEDYIQKNRQDLGTAQQELDLFKREYGDAENILGNIGASAGELGSGLLGFLGYTATMSGNPMNIALGLETSKLSSDISKGIAENREFLRKPVESIESPEGFVNYASDLVANQLPILAVTATGAGGLATIGASSTGQKYTEMNDEVMSGKASYSPFQMATAPLLYGGAEVISELPTMNILKKGGRVFESIVKGESDLIKKSAFENAKEWAKDYGIDMSKEMAGEQFTNFAQNFNDKYILGKDDVNLLDNTGQVFKDTFTLTSILKASPHVFGAIVKPFQTNTSLNTLDENSKKIMEFSAQLENENLTDTERQVIQKQIDKATIQNSKIMANTISDVDSMNPELYDEVVKLNGEIGKIKFQAKDIKDGNLENKQELLNELKGEYSALQNKRTDIIEGKTTVVDILPLPEQEKLKRQALNELTKELNPTGEKDLTIDNEQITERANEIYNKSKSEKINEVAPEVTTEEVESKTEIQKPTNETQEVKEVVIPNQKTPKGVLENNKYTLNNGEQYNIKIYDGINGEVKSFDDRKDKDRLSLVVANEKGENIAHIAFWKDIDGKFYSNNTNVNEGYRRKGIATAVYNYAESLGIDIKPSQTQTKMGESFYKTREKRKEDADYSPEDIIKEETFDYKTGESAVTLEKNQKKVIDEIDKVVDLSKQEQNKTIEKIDESAQEEDIKDNGGVSAGVKPVDEVRVTEQEDTSKESVPKPVEPKPSEAKVEVEEKTLEKKKTFVREPRKRTLLARIKEGGNEKDITESLNSLNDRYNVRNQEKSAQQAVSFVDEVGTVEAINALRTPDAIKETDTRMLVYNEVLDKLTRDIDEASEKNPEDRNELISMFQELSNEFDNEIRRSAQGLSVMNYIYNKNQSLKYNLSKLIRDYKANDANGEIPAEVKAEFERLTKELKEVESKIKDAEKRAIKAEEELAIKNIQEDINRKKELASRNKSGLTETEQKRKKELKNKFFGRLNDVTSIATMLADGEFREYLGLTFKAAKGDLANFSKQILKEIGDGAKKHMPKLFSEAESIYNDVLQKSEAKKSGEVSIGSDGKIKIPAQLFRNYVEAGETDIDVISKKIKEDISEDYPDVDVREIRDALTGYGKQVNPNKDEITGKMNRLKEYGRLLSAYQDVLSREMPKKSGIIRQKTEQKSRELRREVNRLAKELGLETINLEEQWATAIDKIKSNLKNQIEDLDKQIEKGEKRKVERTQTKLDAEAEALKSVRDEKKKILDDLVGKPELTEEQKIARAENALEKSIAKLQEEIDTQNIAYQEKPTALNSAKLENLRAQKKGLLATKQLLREEAGLIEEKRLKTAKTRVKKQISDLEERITNKDFAKKEVKPILADSELNELRAEREELYEHFEKLKYIQELKERSKARKFLDASLEALGLLRALKASLDLGLIGIQLRGFTYSELFRSRKELAKKFWKLFGAIGSQAKADKAMKQLVGHPLFPLAKKLDIGITQPDLRQEVREEMASGNLLRTIWNSPFILAKKAGLGNFGDAKKKSLGDTIIDEYKKQYNKFAKNKFDISEKEKFSRAEQFKNANVFEAIERGLSAYGNQLRFEEFVRGVERLKAEGKDELNHPEDYKALASYIRTFSGRAKPAGFEMNQKLLNVFFFSFKNAVSVFQQLNPVYYAMQHMSSSDFKSGKYFKPSVANKMAMATMLKSLTSSLATMMFILAAYNALKDDDDEEMTVETDPTSSDFGKIRKGDMRYDPWGGYVPLITLYARLWEEEVKKADGSKYKFGEQPFGIQSRGDAATKFLVNKESPGFQAFHHYMTSVEKPNPETGEMERVNKFGEKLSEDEAFSLYPIFLGSVRDAIKEDPDAVKSILTAWSVLGLGNVQNYKSSGGSKKESGGKGSGPKLPSPPKPPTPN